MSSTMSASSTLASSSPTSSSPPSGNPANGPSSPLLFFVALGFGVVFTNLWIIVGVKYCFRYNQRNRQRMNGEDPDAVDMGAVPRQHRRRREKKLMTMEEVNEKFPLTKYKTWRSTRAEEGLPTAGGITTTAASRPASIRNEPRSPKEESSTEELSHTAPISAVDEKATVALSEPAKSELVREGPSSQAVPPPGLSDSRPKSAQSSAIPPDTPLKPTATNEEGEDDDQIQTAVPAEQLPDPGDACAICIDTIEDDDDIRGLLCGHAFHASCVDPWLTSRRACCPLCKADYFVPKPRPEGAEAQASRGPGGNLPGGPQFGFIGAGRGHYGGRGPTMVLPGRFMSIVYNEHDRYGFPRVVREPRPSRAELWQARRASSASAPATTTNETDGNAIANTEGQSGQRSWRQRLASLSIPSPVSRGRGNQAIESRTEAGTTPATENVTPAQLEAGRT